MTWVLRAQRALGAVVGVCLLLLIAGCGSAPKAHVAHKPSPVATPCPVAASSGVWVRGCAVLRDGDSIDLDTGQVDDQTPDLAFANGVLTVAPGTQASYLGARDFDSLTPTDIAAANGGTSSYGLGELQKGGVMAVLTGQGRPAKVQFDRTSSAELDLSFFTYSSFQVTAPTSTPTSTPTPSHHHTPTPTPPTPSSSPSP